MVRWYRDEPWLDPSEEDWDELNYAPDQFEDLLQDLPAATWLDELQGTPHRSSPIVVLDPHVLYGDLFVPPILDELLFAHRTAERAMDPDELDA